MIDFSLTQEQVALADAAAALTRSLHDRGAPDASAATWQVLAEFGALTLLTEAGGGTITDLVALLSSLGAGQCPGPVVATMAAAPCLTGAEVEALAAGRLRVTVVAGEYVPWGATADVVLEVDGEDVWRVECDVDTERPTSALSGEPWPAARTQRVELLPDGVRFVLAAELGLAAALNGMAHALLDQAAAHARTRVQFGRPIGSFQAVAHPLAEAWARVSAAEELVRLVGAQQLAGLADAQRARLARGQASAAALRSAYTVHQAMGGLSFAVETGVGAISTRIRQWSLLLPDVP